MSPEATALMRLCDALLRQGTEQDGNWGHLPFKVEVREIRDSLGTQNQDSELNNEIIKGLDEAETLEERTIERCAQIADDCAKNWDGMTTTNISPTGCARYIAAAIRKLGSPATHTPSEKKHTRNTRRQIIVLVSFSIENRRFR